MATTPLPPSGVLKRKDVDEKYKWRTFDVISTNEEWKAKYDCLDSMLEPLLKLKGHFSEGPEKVVEAFSFDNEIDILLTRLSHHATVLHYQDLNDSEAQGLHSLIRSKSSSLAAQTAWIRPEILALSDDQLKHYQDYPGMKSWLRHFSEIIRYKPHTLSASEEALLSSSSSALSSIRNTYTLLSTVDVKLPCVLNEKGESIQLTRGNYVMFLESFDRKVRQSAWSAMYNSYIAYKNSICSTLDGNIKGEIFRAQIRKYKSCIEHSLFQDDMPLSVYTSLISAIHDALPSFHKYLAIRQRELALPELDMCDVYVSLVPQFELRYTYEEAKELVLAALEPLGADYVSIARHGLTPFTIKDGKEEGGGWVDVFETEGKRSGACQLPNYDSTQSILLNFNGTLDSVFTLAHELGHAMHSYYSSKAQPFQTFSYSTFVAEITSTMNEALLFHYLVEKARKEGNKKMELYLVNKRCDDFKGTIIRQTQFAEFEKEVHEMAERGDALTPDSISQLYKKINDLYYGDSSSISSSSKSFPHVLKADPRIAYEFLRIPHFFLNFYVYTYATSMCTSEALSVPILNGDEDARQKYFTLLKAGCSKPPLEIIRDAGVDLSTPRPFSHSMKQFDQLIDELDSLLKSAAKPSFLDKK